MARARSGYGPPRLHLGHRHHSLAARRILAVRACVRELRNVTNCSERASDASGSRRPSSALPSPQSVRNPVPRGSEACSSSTPQPSLPCATPSEPKWRDTRTTRPPAVDDDGCHQILRLGGEEGPGRGEEENERGNGGAGRQGSAAAPSDRMLASLRHQKRNGESISWGLVVSKKGRDAREG